MANYTIIGGDKKEYGPVTTEEVRQWIAEGRLDGNSQARSAEDVEWRSLSAFPEFSELFQARQHPPTLNPLTRAVPPSVALEVKNPAICLIVSAGLNVLLAFYGTIKALFFPENLDALMAQLPPISDPQAQKMVNSWLHLATGPLAIGSDIFGLVMSAIVLMGAFRMRALRSYEFAFVAAIMAMIPCVTPCCVIGLPFGIWAVIALKKPGVKEQFN
jgi:hypothetical protein